MFVSSIAIINISESPNKKNNDDRVPPEWSTARTLYCTLERFLLRSFFKGPIRLKIRSFLVPRNRKQNKLEEGERFFDLLRSFEVNKPKTRSKRGKTEKSSRPSDVRSIRCEGDKEQQRRWWMVNEVMVTGDHDGDRRSTEKEEKNQPAQHTTQNKSRR